MAAITGTEPKSVDFDALAQHLIKELPRYAIPIFLRFLPAQELTSTFKHQKVSLRNAGFDIGITETPIVPIAIGDERKAVSFWKDLLAHGLYTNAVIFPAVPRNGAILRTSCMATHNAEQIETAIGLLTELGRKHKLIP